MKATRTEPQSMRVESTSSLIAIALALALFTTSSRAEPGKLLSTLHSPVNVRENEFGYSVPASANEILVGCPEDDTGMKDSGSVYVFGKDPSRPRLTIPNPSPGQNNWFGYSVAWVAGNIVAGCPAYSAHGTAGGIAYVLDGKTGSLLKTMEPPESMRNYTHFGIAVSSIGKKILIGAYGESTKFPGAGAVYVYDGDPAGAKFGELTLTIHNPAPAPTDHFGSSVASSGEFIVVGAAEDDGVARDDGSVYLFHATTGELARTIRDPHERSGDRFGYIVAGNNRQILAGAPFDDTGALDSGAVYLIDSTTGETILTLHNPEPAPHDRFGVAVAFVEDKILVGADLNDTGGLDAGAAYLFDSKGKLILKIPNPVPKGSTTFGHCVGAMGTNLLIGAPSSSRGERNAGSLYVFEGSN